VCAWRYEIVVANFSWRTGREDTLGDLCLPKSEIVCKVMYWIS
jgi:hypothetical protein